MTFSYWAQGSHDPIVFSQGAADLGVRLPSKFYTSRIGRQGERIGENAMMRRLLLPPLFPSVRISYRWISLDANIPDDPNVTSMIETSRQENPQDNVRRFSKPAGGGPGGLQATP